MEYIASCSFGKDSIATILLAMEHNEPLTKIMTVEVMFDNARGISGEYPAHMNWVREVAIPRLRELTGIETDIVRTKRDYMNCFYHVVSRSKRVERNGLKRGFPMGGHCVILRDCKQKAATDYLRQYPERVQYLGIAADEPNRLKRIDGIKKISLLAKYGYTEGDAYAMCNRYGLLSPIYTQSMRGGCWFCPNQGVNGFCSLKANYPDLWNELRLLSEVKDCVTHGFCYEKSFEDIEKLVDFRSRQLLLF